MKYNDKAVEKLIDHIAHTCCCPADIGLMGPSACGKVTHCGECWQQALQQEHEEVTE